MSDTDSFIEEVTEEVRRDRLFALMKRYGWIAIAAVFLIVGGAAYNEYSKAQAASKAQAFGNAALAALEANDPIDRAKALEAIEAPNPGAGAVLALLDAQAQFASGDVDKAKATLESLSNNNETPMVYRQVASFKFLGLSATDMSTEERRAGYQALIGGNPQLSVLAEEQIVLIDIEEGKIEEALAGLEALVLNEEATAGLRRRATQLIVALGGDLPETDDPETDNG